MRGFGCGRETKRGASGRNARKGRLAYPPLALTAVCALAACGGGRATPEVGVPAPRRSLETPRSVSSERATPPRLHSTSAIRGDIRFLGGDDAAFDLGPVVIYLVPRERSPHPENVDELPPVVATSRTSEFDPGLVAVGRGRRLVLANEGPLTHGLFSADMGTTRLRLPPGTRTAPFSLPARGPIRFYCTLHADESFVVFASPAEYVAVVDSGETFEFDRVAAGRYTLSIWSRLVEGPVREVFANGFSHSVEPVWIDPTLVGRTLEPERRP